MQGMETGGHEHAEGNVGALIGRYIIYLSLAGFLVNLVIALAGGADDWKVTTLKVGLTWLVGVSGIALGSGHPVHARAGDRAARSMLAEHNLAPGNAGYIFWYDLLAPSLLITLYVATG
jgi:hypothetical protein